MFQRLATNLPPVGRQHPKHHFLSDQHTNQDHQRETLRELLRAHDLLSGTDGDADASQEKNRRDHERGERLRLPQPVRISVRLGQRADPESTPDQKAAENVEHRLHAVRDEGKGISDHPGRDLRGRKNRAHHDADRRHTCASPNRFVELLRRAGTPHFRDSSHGRCNTDETVPTSGDAGPTRAGWEPAPDHSRVDGSARPASRAVWTTPIALSRILPPRPNDGSESVRGEEVMGAVVMFRRRPGFFCAERTRERKGKE